MATQHDRKRARQPGHQHPGNGGERHDTRANSAPGRANQTQYDPRVWGAKYRGRGPVPLAIFFILLLVVGSYLAYTKDLPFVGGGTEVKATFQNATTLRTTSPVRIAGVNVGTVTGVEAEGDVAEVTMTLKDEALPIHEDATATIRPRLFLEGNFFVDLQAGHAVRRRAWTTTARSRSRRRRPRSRSTRSWPRSRATRAKSSRAFCRDTARRSAISRSRSTTPTRSRSRRARPARRRLPTRSATAARRAAARRS